MLLGGYHGTWLPAARAAALTLDNSSLEPAGARVGAGIVISLPPDRCGLVETARVVRYLALESAGQCGPCLNGLPRIAAAFVELATGRPRPRTIEDLQRWSGLVTGRGACHHPDGTARLRRLGPDHVRGRGRPALPRPLLGHQHRAVPADPGRRRPDRRRLDLIP